jgi:hypothetical protein
MSAKAILRFVHLSDIHFGQERNGGNIVDPVVRDRVIADCKQMRNLLGDTDGILVTGDIAFCGKKKQYDIAATWLTNIMDATGCGSPSDICVVPGNHDVDRTAIDGGELALYERIRNAESSDIVEDQFELLRTTRSKFLTKFKNYLAFARAYGCEFKKNQLFWVKNFDIENYKLQIVGFASSLISNDGDRIGNLILGFRQYSAMESMPCMERVILMHHPLHWLIDRSAANLHLMAGARVVLYGHEHDFDAHMASDLIDQQCVFIKAGAVNPERGKEPAWFAYNWLEFGIANGDLNLRVYPRIHPWPGTGFQALTSKLKSDSPDHKSWAISSPNFRQCQISTQSPDPFPPSIPTWKNEELSSFIKQGLDLEKVNPNKQAWQYLLPCSELSVFLSANSTKKEEIQSLADQWNLLLPSHPQLNNWLKNRLALLEFSLNPPVIELPENLKTTLDNCTEWLFAAEAFFKEAKSRRGKNRTSRLEDAKTTAGLVIQSSLFAAGLAAASVLGTEGNDISANLMVPVSKRSLKIASQQNAAIAGSLWSKLRERATRFLVVVEETRSANHLGFWIPLAEGANSELLPGAPKAFCKCKCDSIFLKDEPQLSGFSDYQENWNNYTTRHLREKMFVSVPLIAADTNESVAVLNIDVAGKDDQDDIPWPRAFHDCWLDAALQTCTPFLELAFQAFLTNLAVKTANGTGFSLDTSIEKWNDLVLKDFWTK